MSPAIFCVDRGVDFKETRVSIGIFVANLIIFFRTFKPSQKKTSQYKASCEDYKKVLDC